MFPLKRVSVFFLIAMCLYGVLFVPWISPLPLYRSLLIGVGNGLLPHMFGRDGSVSVEVKAGAQVGQDVTIRMLKYRPQRVSGAMDLSAGHAGYRASAFLFALVLATPIPLKRRGWALLWGFLLVNAFVLLRLWLRLLDGFSDQNALAIFNFGTAVKTELQWAVLMLFRAPEMNFIVPALIWLLVTFRRGDLSAILTPSRKMAKRKQGAARPARGN